MTAATLEQLAEPCLARHPAPLELRLAFGRVGFAVRTNSPELHAKLGRYFRDFLSADVPAEIVVTALEVPATDLGLSYSVKQPDPGKTKVKEEFAEVPGGRVVRKRLTGMLFLFGGGLNLALGPCAANDNQIVNFINNRFIELLVNQGCLLFHAAGVALEGRGLAMAGFSGMGKSTLALHVMRHGTHFVSNDRLMVQREGSELTMYGVAKMPRINPGTVVHNPALFPVIPEAERRRFLAMPRQELWSLEQKYDAFIDECFGPGKFALKSRMAGLALLNWKLDAGPMVPRMIRLVDRPELFSAFMKPVGLFFEDDGPEAARSCRDAGAEAYQELLEGCPVLELSGGVDFEKAALVCLDFLRNGRI